MGTCARLSRMHFRPWGLFAALWLGERGGVSSQVPPAEEIYSRFGVGKPGEPIAGFAGVKFAMADDEVVVFIGQENLVCEQKSGVMESMLKPARRAINRGFTAAWEADTVYEQWREVNLAAGPAQLHAAGATMLVVQFGQMESLLDGPGRLTEFTAAHHRLLDEFAQRTRRVVLLSPLPFESRRRYFPRAGSLSRNADACLHEGNP